MLRNCFSIQANVSIGATCTLTGGIGGMFGLTKKPDATDMKSNSSEIAQQTKSKNFQGK